MAETPASHIGENSPEQIAYKLFEEVARAEDHSTKSIPGSTKPDREWILDTYAECLTAAKGFRAKRLH
jgi:hypothetical protein